MSALTLRLPDDKHARLRALAQSRGTSVNRLLEEVTTLLLAEFDAETRFRLRAERGAGKAERGLRGGGARRFVNTPLARPISAPAAAAASPAGLNGVRVKRVRSRYKFIYLRHAALSRRVRGGWRARS